MILTREIIIKINESNLLYYEELGYDVSIGEALIIPIDLLSTGSHYKIDCECDTCGLVKEVIFKNYIKYGNKWGEYYCRKCSDPKRVKTMLKNHGVDSPIKNPSIKKRIKDTMIDRYGVDNPTKSPVIISKRDKF